MMASCVEERTLLQSRSLGVGLVTTTFCSHTCSLLVASTIQYTTPEQTLVIGASINLRCSAVGVPAPDVVWTRNGIVLMKGESTAILPLKNVTKDFEGAYKCAVNNSGGADDAEVQIKVAGGCLKPIISCPVRGPLI